MLAKWFRSNLRVTKRKWFKSFYKLYLALKYTRLEFIYMHTYELAPNFAAAADRSLAQPQAKFWSARRPDLVRASRKTDGGAAEGSNPSRRTSHSFFSHSVTTLFPSRHLSDTGPHSFTENVVRTQTSHSVNKWGTFINTVFVGRRWLGLYRSPRPILCELDISAAVNSSQYLSEQPANRDTRKYTTVLHRAVILQLNKINETQ